MGNGIITLKNFLVFYFRNGYIWFNSSEQYLNCPNLQHKQDLHIHGGIRGLAGYQKITDYEQKLVTGVESINEDVTNNLEESVRIRRVINQILRYQILVEEFKTLYDNTSQICGVQIAVGNGKHYSEVHHIIPLGKPHNGQDRKENMICVCPNHHALLDFSAILLNLEKFKIRSHSISELSIAYHNSEYEKK